MKFGRDFEIERVDSEAGAIVGSILRTLPEHFGFESPIVDYTIDAQSPRYTTFAAFNSQRLPVGFIMMRDNNADVAEIWVMGIRKTAQRNGLGSELIEYLEKEARSTGHKYVMVKTIGPNENNPDFIKTFNFYLKNGYMLLHQWDYFWGGSWCAFLLKKL